MLDCSRRLMAQYTFSRVTPAFAIWSCHDRYDLTKASDIVVEEVHSMPNQGVKSMFSFGRVYGEILGALQAFRIPYRGVKPLRWQEAYRYALRFRDEEGMLPREKKPERKERLHRVAQHLFPDRKVSKQMADAFLIAHWVFGGATSTSVMGRPVPVPNIETDNHSES